MKILTYSKQPKYILKNSGEAFFVKQIGGKINHMDYKLDCSCYYDLVLEDYPQESLQYVVDVLSGLSVVVTIRSNDILCHNVGGKIVKEIASIFDSVLKNVTVL